MISPIGRSANTSFYPKGSSNKDHQHPNIPNPHQSSYFHLHFTLHRFFSYNRSRTFTLLSLMHTHSLHCSPHGIYPTSFFLCPLGCYALRGMYFYGLKNLHLTSDFRGLLFPFHVYLLVSLERSSSERYCPPAEFLIQLFASLHRRGVTQNSLTPLPSVL